MFNYFESNFFIDLKKPTSNNGIPQMDVMLNAEYVNMWLYKFFFLFWWITSFVVLTFCLQTLLSSYILSSELIETTNTSNINESKTDFFCLRWICETCNIQPNSDGFFPIEPLVRNGEWVTWWRIFDSPIENSFSSLDFDQCTIVGCLHLCTDF